MEALAGGGEDLTLLEKEGAIQRFECTFELAWKCLKDFLEEGGLVVSPVTPRQVLKEAFAAKILPDGQTWIEMLDHRNLLSHKDDAAVFAEAVRAVSSRYLPAFGQLHTFLKGQNFK